MAIKKDIDCIFKDIVSNGGSGESSRVYLVADIKTGKSELVIEKTITERYPLQEYGNVIDLYERLNCGSGRKVFTLKELAHPYNPGE